MRSYCTQYSTHSHYTLSLYTHTTHSHCILTIHTHNTQWAYSHYWLIILYYLCNIHTHTFLKRAHPPWYKFMLRYILFFKYTISPIWHTLLLSHTYLFCLTHTHQFVSQLSSIIHTHPSWYTLLLLNTHSSSLIHIYPPRYTLLLPDGHSSSLVHTCPHPIRSMLSSLIHSHPCWYKLVFFDTHSSFLMHSCQLWCTHAT